MYFLYSIAYSIGFVLMVPAFLLNRAKYASGFRERLGNYPKFAHDDRKVIWLHCVSVGETNAARPLVDKLHETFPDHRLIISATTKTGQELAKKIFADKVDAVFYFPFDWKFTVRRAIDHFKPSAVLLMETEIWPRLIHEAKLSGAKVVIVNGRLSETSFRRYSKVRGFISRVLAELDLALMQNGKDAERIIELGLDQKKTNVTGNLKFEQKSDSHENELTSYFENRFGIDSQKMLIIAASTHEPEETYVMESLEGLLGHNCRLLIAPRHPERFDTVATLIRKNSNYNFVRRSDAPSENDREAEVILLDSIGELRAAYPLAEIVFVGGSLIPHGGQSVIEPATEGKAIITGPHTKNFEAVITEFLENEAIRQTPPTSDSFEITERLFEEFNELIHYDKVRSVLGQNAAAVTGKVNLGATAKTIDLLRSIL